MRNAMTGLVLGPLVAAMSISFNILAMGAGVSVLEAGLRLAGTDGNGTCSPER